MLTTIPTSLDKKETRRYRNDGAERKQTERSPRREPWLGSKSGGPLPHTGINGRLPRHYRESGNPVFLVSWIPARAGCRQLGRSGGKVLLRIYETPHWVAARASMVTLLKLWVKNGAKRQHDLPVRSFFPAMLTAQAALAGPVSGQRPAPYRAAAVAFVKARAGAPAL